MYLQTSSIGRCPSQWMSGSLPCCAADSRTALSSSVSLEIFVFWSSDMCFNLASLSSSVSIGSLNCMMWDMRSILAVLSSCVSLCILSALYNLSCSNLDSLLSTSSEANFSHFSCGRSVLVVMECCSLSLHSFLFLLSFFPAFELSVLLFLQLF